jgi:F0F1-type ATP synthase epsilon subunit
MPIQRQQELALGLNRLQGFVAGLVERAQQRATDRAAVSGGLVEVSPEDVAAVQAEMLEEEALRRRAAQ